MYREPERAVDVKSTARRVFQGVSHLYDREKYRTINQLRYISRLSCILQVSALVKGRHTLVSGK